MTVKTTPSLMIYKEVVAGDLRKLAAASNDATSGGGARDLRLPAATFGRVLNDIFTRSGVGRGGRAIRCADVIYLDDKRRPEVTSLELWPETASRGTEIRIAKVHASPALGGRMPSTDKGRVFVLLIKYSDGRVRCEYAYEHDLRSPGVWSQMVSSSILSCMEAADEKNASRIRNLVPAQGYIDFENGGFYCHGE